VGHEFVRGEFVGLFEGGDGVLPVAAAIVGDAEGVPVTFVLGSMLYHLHG